MGASERSGIPRPFDEALLDTRTPAEFALAPVSQGQLLYGALLDAGCETELVVLPGEGHVPVSRRYALEAICRTQAWFVRFMRP